MIFSLFLMSGLVHQVTSWQLNPACNDYADLQFFCMNAVAVCLESAVLRHISSNRPSDGTIHETKKRYPQKLLRKFVRFVGYAWVLGFFVWSVPKFYYHRVSCMIDQQLQVRGRMA